MRMHVATGDGVATAILVSDGVGVAIAKVMDDPAEARGAAATSAARSAGLRETAIVDRAGERLLIGDAWVETRVEGEHAVAWVVAAGKASQ